MPYRTVPHLALPCRTKITKKNSLPCPTKPRLTQPYQAVPDKITKKIFPTVPYLALQNLASPYPTEQNYLKKFTTVPCPTLPCLAVPNRTKPYQAVPDKITKKIPYRALPHRTLPCHASPCHKITKKIPYQTGPCFTVPNLAMPCHALPYRTKLLKKIPYLTEPDPTKHYRT